jgi:hypothetical protein
MQHGPGAGVFQDPDDIEEWFGIVRLVQDGNGYVTEPRPVYDEVRAARGL